jgi:hypothetical protein
MNQHIWLNTVILQCVLDSHSIPSTLAADSDGTRQFASRPVPQPIFKPLLPMNHGYLGDGRVDRWIILKYRL